MIKEFENKNILITGAASGIGKELAMFFSTQNSNLILIDINHDALHLNFHHLSNAHLYSIDIANANKMKELAVEIWENKKIKLDYIIACAGIGGINPGNNFSVELDQLTMSVNYFGNINTIVFHIPYLIKFNVPATIVGISSLASFRGMPGAASYCSSKAAQANFLESLRIDLKKYKIKVISIFPGFIETPMTAHDAFDKPFMISAQRTRDEIIKAIVKNKRRHYFPFRMYLLTKINSLLPCFIFDLIASFIAQKNKNDKPIKF